MVYIHRILTANQYKTLVPNWHSPISTNSIVYGNNCTLPTFRCRICLWLGSCAGNWALSPPGCRNGPFELGSLKEDRVSLASSAAQKVFCNKWWHVNAFTPVPCLSVWRQDSSNCVTDATQWRILQKGKAVSRAQLDWCLWPYLNMPFLF